MTLTSEQRFLPSSGIFELRYLIDGVALNLWEFKDGEFSIPSLDVDTYFTPESWYPAIKALRDWVNNIRFNTTLPNEKLVNNLQIDSLRKTNKCKVSLKKNDATAIEIEYNNKTREMFAAKHPAVSLNSNEMIEYMRLVDLMEKFVRAY